jgi:FlaA1/EpsC-like NDP-sugar epimerase
MMSRGSVVPSFLKNKSSGILNITDKNMTRFSITLEEGVNFVLFALAKSIGQEILVPKLSSYNILDLAKAVCEKSKIRIIGIRNGEKIHEEMITKSDSYNTIESKNFYVILPSMIENYYKYLKLYKAKKINKPFSYNSLDNQNKLTREDLKYLVYKK